MNKRICDNCILKVGDYCFCGDEPERLNDKNIITECDYFYDNTKSSYYDFIDGYTHCNKLKQIALHKTTQKLMRKIKELESRLEVKNEDSDK